MKKLLLLTTFLLPALAHADSKTDYQFNPEQLILNTTVVLVFYFAGAFILSLIKMRLNASFREKLVESDRSDDTVGRLLQPAERERKDEAFRNMAVLAGVGVGLALVYATEPIGFHSLAIMAFCVSLSFLGYYFYLQRKPDKPNQPEGPGKPNEQ